MDYKCKYDGSEDFFFMVLFWLMTSTCLVTILLGLIVLCVDQNLPKILPLRLMLCARMQKQARGWIGRRQCDLHSCKGASRVRLTAAVAVTHVLTRTHI